MTYKKYSKNHGVDSELEKRIREELKIKPCGIYPLSKKIGIRNETLNYITGRMSDVYEGDDRKLRLIGAAYERG